MKCIVNQKLLSMYDDETLSVCLVIEFSRKIGFIEAYQMKWVVTKDWKYIKIRQKLIVIFDENIKLNEWVIVCIKNGSYKNN